MKLQNLNFKFNLKFNLQGKMKLRDFAKERYLLLAKRFPIVKQENMQVYFMLTLSFITMSLLGLFAISPTLATIVELNKKLADSKFVLQALETKKDNLSALHTQYDNLQSSWPVVNAAVPDSPKAAYVVGQIQQLAKENNLLVTSVQVFPVELTKKTKLPTDQASYAFIVNVEGENDQFQTFLQSLNTFDRIIRIEGVTLANNEKQVLTVRMRAYFTP